MWPMVLGWEHPRPQRASGGRESGKDRRKGISETGAAEYEAYSYGGFGYSFQSPFAVPQAYPGGGKTGDLPQIQRWMVHIRCLYHHSNRCTVWEYSLERKKHWIFNMWITYKWLTLLKTKDNPRLVGWGKASQFLGSWPGRLLALCQQQHPQYAGRNQVEEGPWDGWAWLGTKGLLIPLNGETRHGNRVSRTVLGGINTAYL